MSGKCSEADDWNPAQRLPAGSTCAWGAPPSPPHLGRVARVGRRLRARIAAPGEPPGGVGAQTFAEQGDMEGAKDMIQRATVAAPSDHRPPYLMGVVLGGQGKWQEAAEQLERSVSLKDDASARYSLGVIWRYHLKDEAKARPHFEKASALSRDPSLTSMIKAELDKTAGTK